VYPIIDSLAWCRIIMVLNSYVFSMHLPYKSGLAPTPLSSSSVTSEPHQSDRPPTPLDEVLKQMEESGGNRKLVRWLNDEQYIVLKKIPARTPPYSVDLDTSSTLKEITIETNKYQRLRTTTD
jgi:hypothetical protein